MILLLLVILFLLLLLLVASTMPSIQPSIYLSIYLGTVELAYERKSLAHLAMQEPIYARTPRGEERL